jgi:hypothetical protein
LPAGDGRKTLTFQECLIRIMENLEQKDHEFEASLGYIARSYLKKEKEEVKEKNREFEEWIQGEKGPPFRLQLCRTGKEEKGTKTRDSENKINTGFITKWNCSLTRQPAKHTGVWSVHGRKPTEWVLSECVA